MFSKDFLNGIEFELQNRAFALKAITRISNRMQGTPEHVFWNAYERLENFNTAIYSAYAEKLAVDATPSFFTKLKASTLSSTPSFLLDELLKLVYSKTKVYIYLAREMKASCYGHVGVTATASENLGVAIGVLEQFIGLHCVAFQPKLYIEQEMAYLNFKQPLNNFKFNHHAIIFLVLGFVHILENLAQQNLDIQIELQGNSQDIFRNLDNYDGYRINLGADEDRLIFNKELLCTRQISQNPYPIRVLPS